VGIGVGTPKGRGGEERRKGARGEEKGRERARDDAREGNRNNDFVTIRPPMLYYIILYIILYYIYMDQGGADGHHDDAQQQRVGVERHLCEGSALDREGENPVLRARDGERRGGGRTCVRMEEEGTGSKVNGVRLKGEGRGRGGKGGREREREREREIS
jgi:hypothetical protein